MAEQETNIETLPLPPLLSLNPQKRLPPDDLVEEVGSTIATQIHNYYNVGSIYRYLDLYEGKVKTVLSGVEANLFMMHHSKDYLSARQYRHQQIEALASEKYLVAMDGEEHYRLRKVQKRGYARSVLDDRYAELLAIVRRHTAQWQPGQTIPVRRFMQEIIAEQLGATILNYPTPDYWKDLCFYIDMMLAMSFVTQDLGDERQEAYEKAQSRVMDLADEIIAAHRKHPPSGHRPDLVDDLLAVMDEDKDLLNEQDLRISVLTPYVAGINPVAHTCTFMLYALLDHPHILKQVVNEIDAAFAGEPPSPALLRKMDLLRYATLEALRMFPFAPILQMIASEPFEFGGYLVKRGTNVVIGMAVSHYLSEIYPDPFKFVPERYTPERAENRQPGTYVPYGAGPHICLGAGFAEAQIMLTIAALLSSVQLEIDPASQRPLIAMRGRNSFTARVVKQRN
jgi:cytochrome P450